ncbi:helix-turn-helix domain-containing protein [Erysipelothrix anatis]|uniref:helix-turn-helix domain-containing protein n=1 Tax=Erysipelothrix anatis TaxID=2683713 RepID=UPI00135BEC2D|nr:helix-turn-helix transcriptional regulator [Erysipelothrix anatis]
MEKSYERIKRYRIDRKLSQPAVVERLSKLGVEINQSTLSRYESGKYPLTEDVIKGLSKIYNVSVVDIMFSDEEK